MVNKTVSCIKASTAYFRILLFLLGASGPIKQNATTRSKNSDYYKNNIYITPGGLFSAAQVKYAIEELGADNIIYSHDYPFLVDTKTRQFIESFPKKIRENCL